LIGFQEDSPDGRVWLPPNRRFVCGSGGPSPSRCIKRRIKTIFTSLFQGGLEIRPTGRRTLGASRL
jgi:hypothetical protein